MINKTTMNYKILKNKLEQYYEGNIELSELGSLAAGEYYDILRGGYVMTEKIAVYKFLKILSKINTAPDDIRDEYPCPPEEIRRIYEILRGDVNDIHTIRVKIPRRIYDIYGNNPHLSLADWEEKAEIRKILPRLSENLPLTDCETEILNSVLNKPLATPQTLPELLEILMKSLLGRILHHSNNRSAFGLYAGRNEFSDAQAISDLEKILDCCIGEKSFTVCAAYLSGIPNISLII